MYHAFGGLKQMNTGTMMFEFDFGKQVDVIRQYCFPITDGSRSDSNIMAYVIFNACCVFVIVAILFILYRKKKMESKNDSDKYVIMVDLKTIINITNPMVILIEIGQYESFY